MNAGIAIVLLIALLCLIFALLRGQNAHRTAAPNSALVLEYRTDLPLDICMDTMRTAQENDIFAYEFKREPDGSFSLHFTQHRATQQPIDTLYSLRMESGKQTVLTLVFLREAFGYKEPVFPLALLDEFFAAKLSAQRQVV